MLRAAGILEEAIPSVREPSVLIAIVCPHCTSRFQVDASLRGKKIKCPNTNCGQIFEVREITAPPTKPPDIIEGVPVDNGPVPQPGQGQRRSGRIGEVVPMLSAEIVVPASINDLPRPLPAPAPPNATPQPPDAPDWRTAPPPQRGAAAPPPVTPPATPAKTSSPSVRMPAKIPVSQRAPSPPIKQAAPTKQPPPKTPPPPPPAKKKQDEPKDSGGPVVLPPGAWEAPPVRRGSAGSSSPDTPDQATLDARAKTRRARRLMLGIVVGLLFILGGGGGIVWVILRGEEGRLAREANDQFAKEQFPQAATTFARLIDKYPESPQLDEYRFLHDLSEVRALAASVDSRSAFDKVSAFLAARKGDPRLDPQGKGIGQTLTKLMEESGKFAKENVSDANAQASFDRGKAVLAELDAIDRNWRSDEDRKKVDALDGEVGKLREEEAYRVAVVNRLKALAEKPSAESIRQALAILREEAGRPQQLDQRPEIVALITKMYDDHVKSVTFTEQEAALGGRGEDFEPSLLTLPPTRQPSPGPTLASDRVIFALARGVLYALRQSDGEVVWAMRVGIDTYRLPLRLPASGGQPETALVLSADTATLTAVNARTGDPLWKYRLSAPCLGRPVIVGRRAYVPTYDGQVHEIELAEGQLLGRYNLGQRLSGGGVRMRGTRTVYFPADDTCVYALDVANRKCSGILYSEHAAGSLRGEPILIPAGDPGAGYLVLPQTSGLDAMLLRAFRLPLEGARTEPVAMEEPRLRGWSWFPPLRDPEKLVTVTDAGELGLFGIAQAPNQDSPLFPLVRQSAMPGIVDLPGLDPSRGRAQVAHATESDLWVLARGQLQRWRIEFTRSRGWQLIPYEGWPRSLALGSPLHEAQTDRSAADTDDETQSDEPVTTLFLVTQAPNGQTCLATAVDIETGLPRWQRQLGLNCAGDPLVVGGQVLAADRGGAWLRYDPARHKEIDAQWQAGAIKLFDPLDEGVADGTLHLLPGADGASAYEIVSPAAGRSVTIRRYVSGSRDVKAKSFELRARLTGTPAVGEQGILLPLADGSTLRVPLPLGESEAHDGPDWLFGRAGPEVRGHAAWLGGDEFLLTNGNRGAVRVKFTFDKDLKKWGWSLGGATPATPTLSLPEGAKLAGAPAVLPADGNTPLRVVLADESGRLHLFEGDTLRPSARPWTFKGRPTGGPFVRGGAIAYILDRNHLIWLDPARGEPLWEYVSPGEGIVGRPNLIDGSLIVADVSGRFVALDPATGKVRGPGYALKGSVAPAAAPVAFGPGRAFAPLSDGTVLLLSLSQLDHPLRGFPMGW
jgi:predicted Zn finger-like uncharacterized protein